MEPVLGGILIGVATSAMLIFLGRIAGISGIVMGLLQKKTKDFAWRFSFLLGLIAGGWFLFLQYPIAFNFESHTPYEWVAVAGVFVGFGTSLGSGCTSGHGVCGVARLSPRSIVATLLFMAAGMFTSTILRGILF